METSSKENSQGNTENSFDSDDVSIGTQFIRLNLLIDAIGCR